MVIIVVTVIAALVEIDNKILIARRKEGDAPSIGKWEFPGGKIEEGETERQAVEREMQEEFGVKVEAQDYITSSIWDYPTRTIEVRLYRCKYIEGDFHLYDHLEIKFVTKEELSDYDFVPADKAFAKFLREN